MKSENIYISALEYAEEMLNANEGVSFTGLADHLRRVGFEVETIPNNEPGYSFLCSYIAILLAIVNKTL